MSTGWQPDNQPFDPEKWADAYIRVHDDRANLNEAHPDYLAAYEFMIPWKGSDAENCWSGILAVVRRRPSEHVLGMVAAGLIEDLLDESGELFIQRIEDQCRVDPVFRQMLLGAWESGPATVWSRVHAARTET